MLACQNVRKSKKILKMKIVGQAKLNIILKVSRVILATNFLILPYGQRLGTIQAIVLLFLFSSDRNTSWTPSASAGQKIEVFET